MRQFALHRFLVTAGLELLALLALSSGAASHHMVPVMARTYEPQQETIYIDNNDMRTCFNPLLPCPQPFETWFEGDRMYGTIERTSGGYRDSTLDAIGVDPDGIVPALPFGARWNLIQNFPAGNYRVEVNIPSVSYRGAAIVSVAFYVIRRGNQEETVGVSQRTERGWVDLGTYYFEPGLMGELARNSVSIDVQSSYNTDINSTLIDAVRFVPIVEPPQPITVDAYLVGVPESGHVSAGTRVRHCYSISRAAPIRWSWFKEGTGWSPIKDDPAGQGECTDSDPLQGAGQRKTQIQALSGGSVVAEDQTTFYVDEASVPPTTIPSAVPTSTPPPSVTPTPVRSIQVWIESGCGRTYTVGQAIRVGVQADSPGIARLSFQPQGIEFAVRALRAGSPEMIETVVEGPPGAQALQALLEVSNQTVATDSCEFRVDVPETPTPERPTPTPTAEPRRSYLPMAVRGADLRPLPPGRPVDIVFVVDTAAAMRQSFGTSPSRLAATISSMSDAFRRLSAEVPGDRAAVLAYTLQPSLIQDFTTDTEALRTSSSRLLSEPATTSRLEPALYETVRIMGSARMGVERVAVVISTLSPGLDVGESELSAARLVKDSGIRIMVVALGEEVSDAWRQLASRRQDSYVVVNPDELDRTLVATVLAAQHPTQ